VNEIISKYILLMLAGILLAACSSSVRYTKTEYEIKKSEDNLSEVLETETGTASYYADEFNGKKTASGEIYNMNKLTAAHPSYPMNTVCLITNLKNGLSVEVRINDRMPSFKSRIIDLSLAAAKEIDMIRDGIQEVKIEVLEWGSK
jgi:rare lipoprotein A